MTTPTPSRGSRIATGADFVRSAKRGADWRAYATAHGLSGDWRRARRYGLSPRELHALYLKQEGSCYLCGDPLPKNLTRSAVDHDHTCCPGQNAEATSTHKVSCGKCVRGIACNACNRLIASAQDDPDRLRRIADNLEAANLRVGREERIRAYSANADPSEGVVDDAPLLGDHHSERPATGRNVRTREDGTPFNSAA